MAIPCWISLEPSFSQMTFRSHDDVLVFVVGDAQLSDGDEEELVSFSGDGSEFDGCSGAVLLKKFERKELFDGCQFSEALDYVFVSCQIRGEAKILFLPTANFQKC